MKLLYVANVRIPSERAHSAQIMKTCEALARTGAELTLLVPDRKTLITEDPFRYYGVTTTFPIMRLPVWDLVHRGFWGFLIEQATFIFSARRFLKHFPNDVIYGRDEWVLWGIRGAARAPLVWESHVGAWNFAARALTRAIKKFVVISEGLKRIYAGRGVPLTKILVAHDGVDLGAFTRLPTPPEARKILGLPEKATAMYVGSLGGWKGTETFFKAASFAPEIQFAVVGGKKHEVEALRRRYPKVRFLGERPYRDAPLSHAAGDCIVIPNTGRDPVSAHMTSPLKVFTAMAAGRPIVASNIQSLREILDESEALFVTPDDPAAFAEGIRAALRDTGEARRRAQNARRAAERFSWDARAKRIVDFLKMQNA